MPYVALAVPKSKRPFIVDIEASLLKRNARLSKAARSLYGTMCGLADGKTKELAINGHPLDWSYIAREAEIGRCSWLKYLRELTIAGLVRTERERVTRIVDGRKRVVFGRAHYFVPRQAISEENIKKQPILLRSISSTVQEVDPQDFQKHRRFESSQVTQKEKKPFLPLDRVQPRSPEHRKANTEKEIPFLKSPHLTKSEKQTKNTAPVQKNPETKDRRPDLTLGSVLGVRPKLFVNQEDFRGMGNAERIWREAGCPVQAHRLIDVLEQIISESPKTGVGYPRFIMLRKKELQRGSFRPRVQNAVTSTANRWTPPSGSCPKCGGIGMVVRPGGASGSLCDCGVWPK
jgi:hypothetical protein